MFRSNTMSSVDLSGLFDITQRPVLINTSASENRENVSNESSTTLSLYDQGVISLQQLNAFYWYRPLLIPLLIVGLVTSTLNVVVNCRCARDAYVLYFTGVSVGDAVFIICICSPFIVNLLYPPSSEVYEKYSLYIYTFANTVFRRGAIVLNGIASSERFIKLIFPFHVSRNILSRYPRCVVIAVFILSFLVHLSLIVELEVREVKDNIWMMVTSKVQAEFPLLFVVLRNVGRVAFVYVPTTYLLMINVALVAALQMHAAKQGNIRTTRGVKVKDESKIRGGKQDQVAQESQVSDGRNIQTEAVMRTSRLVLILTFTFFLLALPSTVNATASSFVPDYGLFTRNRYLTYLLVYLTDLVGILTQPVLFTVSLVISRQFRKSLLETLNLHP